MFCAQDYKRKAHRFTAKGRVWAQLDLGLIWTEFALWLRSEGKTLRHSASTCRGTEILTDEPKLIRSFVIGVNFYPCCFAVGWCLHVWRGGWGTVRHGVTACARSLWFHRRKLHCNLEKDKLSTCSETMKNWHWKEYCFIKHLQRILKFSSTGSKNYVYNNAGSQCFINIIYLLRSDSTM